MQDDAAQQLAADIIITQTSSICLIEFKYNSSSFFVAYFTVTDAKNHLHVKVLDTI